MDIQKISNHIFLVEGKNKGRFPSSHSILIRDEKNVLIDTGCGLDALRKIRREEDIDFIINSHSHTDHSAGNWLFGGIPIYVPQEEFSFNGKIAELAERYASGEFLAPWKELVTGVMGFCDIAPTNAFSDGNVFDLGETRLEAIHAPGHTEGHYCFFVKTEKMLFSSDIDFTEFGPWYGNEESDIADFKKSIKRVRSFSPEKIISSHRGIIEKDIPSEFDKYLSKFDERENAILALLKKGRTVEELVGMAPIYRRATFGGMPLAYREKKMIKKHLALLVDQGKVERRGKVFIGR